VTSFIAFRRRTVRAKDPRRLAAEAAARPLTRSGQPDVERLEPIVVRVASFSKGGGTKKC
jgi:hypothetical protein